jgi:hypothetical protein
MVESSRLPRPGTGRGRRSKTLIIAERLVIPANEPESRKKGYKEASGCRIKSGMT